MLVHVVAGKIETIPGGTKQFEDDINTFLRQHSSEEIEAIQTSCASGGTGIGETYFNALCVIVFNPRVTTKKASKKKAKK